MAASTSCSALIGSAPWICARRRRERLAETLAPVGPQAPPAPSARCALDSASERRGALLWTTGTSGVRANLSIMSPNTCPPCLRPLQGARGVGIVRQQPPKRFYGCFSPPPARGLLTAKNALPAHSRTCVDEIGCCCATFSGSYWRATARGSPGHCSGRRGIVRKSTASSPRRQQEHLRDKRRGSW